MRNFVDHEANFRMGRPSTNLSQHRKIDSDFAQALNGGVAQYREPKVAYEARFNAQIGALKESGGLGHSVIRNGMYKIADEYGFDKRKFNGW